MHLKKTVFKIKSYCNENFQDDKSERLTKVNEPELSLRADSALAEVHILLP